jgi:cell division protein FtsB
MFECVASLAPEKTADPGQIRRSRCQLVWHAGSVDTPCVRSYAFGMPRLPRPAPGDLATSTPDDGSATPEPSGEGRGASVAPSLAGLGVAGISRRRIAWVVLVALAAWIVIAFAGQAASAAQASADVAEARARNVAAAAESQALRRELELVTQERWILQQARAYRLGSRKERPFALAPDAPSLPPDAPGSQARRLGAEAERPTPLEAWLEVLFGPAADR